MGDFYSFLGYTLNFMKIRFTLYWQGFCWLTMLVPFFFLTYGQVNQFTAGRANVGSFVFGWEHFIPFIPITIIPYWSLDLLYGISLFVCTSLKEQRRLVCKLVMASLIACIGFLLFPLRLTFIRPEVTGIYGWFFQQLEQFDYLPYNQSPSLHIILCWILWRHFNDHLYGILKKICMVWFLLIAISTLTTGQHHFIDVVTGLVVGMIIDWFISHDRKLRWQTTSRKRKKIAIYYCTGSFICLGGTIFTYWLWWPTLSLIIVALAYGVFGVEALQKGDKGRLTTSTWWLLLPWRIGMMFSMYLYTRKLPEVNHVIDGVFLGIYPCKRPKQFAVLDLSSEFSRSNKTQNIVYQCVPMLDLVTPSEQDLSFAVQTLEKLHTTQGSVLVHCALGLSRSALVVAAWMLQRYPNLNVDNVVVYIKKIRPQIVLTSEHIEMLNKWNDLRCVEIMIDLA